MFKNQYIKRGKCLSSRTYTKLQTTGLNVEEEEPLDILNWLRFNDCVKPNPSNHRPASSYSFLKGCYFSLHADLKRFLQDLCMIVIKRISGLIECEKLDITHNFGETLFELKTVLH